jgi:hypothetical protein
MYRNCQYQSFGSGFNQIKSDQWIRIWNPDPDPGLQKLLAKIEKSYKISCIEVLDVLFWGVEGFSCSLGVL